MASAIANGASDSVHEHEQPIPNVYTASSVSEIKAALEDLSKREARVTARLDTLLASQKDLTRTLSRLDLARAHLGAQAIATRSISNGMLSSATRTASRLSSAVKTLDQEQAAVKATLQVVEQVAELKACVLGVNGSMGAPQDWETAATYLQRARQIPDEVIDGGFAEEIVPTAEVPDPPRQTLDAASESLCGLFLREFDKAAREGDGARVTRFFKLFPLIGRSGTGLDAYGRYVCGGIASRARNNMNNSTQRGQGGMFYANALTKLFEHIAQIVDGHEPLVERHYGAGSMTKVIERIQVEADVQGGIILDTWAEEGRVARKLTDVKSYPFNFLVQSFLPYAKPSNQTPRSGSPAPHRRSEDETVDMKEIDALLNESALMLGRWSLYTRFVASKTSPADENMVPDFLGNSSLSQKITSHLTEPFTLASTFFFRRSVEKAFQLDESPAYLTLNPNKQLPASAQPPYITSAVDDVMYILSQVLTRTLSTGQTKVVSSVGPSLARVLGSDFFGMIQRRMRDECYPKPAIQGALPPESTIIAFLVLMNNADVATDYVRRIVRSSNPSIQERFSTPEPVEKVLQNLETGFAAKTNDLLTEATEVMLKQVIRPRLRPVLIETFREVDYLTTANRDSDEVEDDNIITSRFAKGWLAFTQPLHRLLTAANYDRLLTTTISYLSRTLEKRLWSLQGRVSSLGAVRLERDIAGIVAVAVKGGRYELRDAFARSTQITLILNMEEDEWEEIRRLGGEELERVSGVSWELDAEERERARGILST